MVIFLDSFLSFGRLPAGNFVDVRLPLAPTATYWLRADWVQWPPGGCKGISRTSLFTIFFHFFRALIFIDCSSIVGWILPYFTLFSDTFPTCADFAEFAPRLGGSTIFKVSTLRFSINCPPYSKPEFRPNSHCFFTSFLPSFSLIFDVISLISSKWILAFCIFFALASVLRLPGSSWLAPGLHFGASWLV